LDGRLVCRQNRGRPRKMPESNRNLFFHISKKTPSMKIEPCPLAGAAVISLPAFEDARGIFVKTFHNRSLKEAGIDFELKESYFSFSKKNVLRGMHFQLPPHQHSKIVFCPQGAILDVMIDLR